MTRAEEIRNIIVEAVLPHAPEVVWKTLTTPDLIDQWLMPNDFVAVIGKKFNFKTKPIGDWDGVVDCEVLEIIENGRLAYSWKGGSGENAIWLAARYHCHMDPHPCRSGKVAQDGPRRL
ncbi:MAG: SRPBCC family protein [Methylocella sp.]